MDIYEIAEEGRYDDVGTIRVCEKFGTIAIYIKVAQNAWRTVYIDPLREQHLVGGGTYGDKVATLHPIAFAPKSVE